MKRFMRAVPLNSVLANFNNFPITLAPVSGAMPGGLTASRTYYMRNLELDSWGGGRGPRPGPGPGALTNTFNIASELDQAPIASFADSGGSLMTVTLPALGSCASQENVAPYSFDPDQRYFD